MFAWDFNKHLVSLHRKCDRCQQNLKNDDQLQDHMELEHPTVTDMHIGTELQVTTDPATLNTSHQDCQVKCKYCDRYFSSIVECNMHINRRHKKHAQNVKSVL